MLATKNLIEVLEEGTCKHVVSDRWYSLNRVLITVHALKEKSKGKQAVFKICLDEFWNICNTKVTYKKKKSMRINLSHGFLFGARGGTWIPTGQAPAITLCVSGLKQLPLPWYKKDRTPVGVGLFYLVREAGLDPARPEWALEPESSESANSTTRASRML